jgi:chromosome segregation ATPase
LRYYLGEALHYLICALNLEYVLPFHKVILLYHRCKLDEKMSALKELEKLQAMRAELEAESRSLKEQQKELENNVLALEQKVVMEELDKEKAVIEELKNSNKSTKDAIAQLEAKKKELEARIGQAPQKPETPPPEKEKKEEAPKPEEAEEGGVTVTAIEGEALVESPEATEESPKKKEKKKHRFF